MQYDVRMVSSKNVVIFPRSLYRHILKHATARRVLKFHWIPERGVLTEDKN